MYQRLSFAILFGVLPSLLQAAEVKLPVQENQPSLEQMKEDCGKDLAPSCVQLGNHFLKTANSFEAEKAFRHGCDKGSPTACTLLGIQYEKASNFDAAENLYKAGCKAGEERPSGCLQLMNLAIRRNKLDSASDWLASSCSMGIPAACEASGVSRLRLNHLDGNRILADACIKGSQEACRTYRKVLTSLSLLLLFALSFACLLFWFSVRKGTSTPGVLQGAGLAIAVIALQLAGLVFLNIVPGLRNANEGLVALTSITAGWICLLGLVFYMGAQRFKKTFMLERFQIRFLPVFAGLSVGLSIGTSEGNNILQSWVELPNLIPLGLFTGESEAYGLIWLCIVAPVCEELFFRGFLFRGLRARYGWKTGALLSAVLFSVFHGNPAQLFPALVLGLSYAWVVQKTGSLWPALFLHALNNATAAFSSGLGISIQGFNAQPESSPVLQPLWFDALGIVLSMIAIWAIARIGWGQTEAPLIRSPSMPAIPKAEASEEESKAAS